MSLLMAEPTTMPDQPVKRKRGRPPKANKPEDAFPTFTMQLESSPLSGSPNAELTSSQVVRIGEPDSFKPMMKVSPSPHRKKRRKSSNFHSPLDPPKFPKINELSAGSNSYITSSGHALQAQVLDSLSSAMGELSDSGTQLRTPPDSVLRPGFVLSASDSGRRRSREFKPPKPKILNNAAEASEVLGRDSTYYVPSAPRGPEPLWETSLTSDAHEELDLFGFELVIDESGQANLADRRSSAVSNENYMRKTGEQSQKIGEREGQAQESGLEFHALERTHSLPALTHSAYAKDESFRIETFTRGFSPKVEESMVIEKYSQTCSEFDASMYHMIESHAQTYKKLKHESINGDPQDLVSFPLKKSDLFDGFSIDTSSLVLDENSPDVSVENADARCALRKVFRRN